MGETGSQEHKLTVQVERHGAGYWLGDIVIGGVARQHAMQMAPLQPLQVQHILHPFIREHHRFTRQDRVLVHPRYIGQRRACVCFFVLTVRKENDQLVGN